MTADTTEKGLEDLVVSAMIGLRWAVINLDIHYFILLEDGQD